MKFIFTEKKMEVSEALRDYAEKKLSKLDRFFKQEAEARVAFSVERGRHHIEVTLFHGGMVYRAAEDTSNMYASIDSAAAYIERQIHKYKTKLGKRLRQGAFDKEIPGAGIGQPEAGATGDDEDEAFAIIRTKKFDLKPMTNEEAILQMNLLNHQFFVFRNSSMGGAFSVAYKRSRGGYGIIVGE
ncbi:MAG: ribosome-associated translation inhibitor RaiA [Oscillospiraceae bacterium]|nr:ribosome-associated translation inhibitor RaiA [Oscillospiraceae bacterium]